MSQEYTFTNYSAQLINIISHLQKVADNNNNNEWIELYGEYAYTNGNSESIEAVLVSGHHHKQLFLSEKENLQKFPEKINKDNEFVGTFKLQLIPVTTSISLLVLQSTTSIRKIAPIIDIALLGIGRKSVYIGRHDKEFMISQLKKNTKDLSNDPIQYEKNIERLYDVIIASQKMQSQQWFDSIEKTEAELSGDTVPYNSVYSEANLGILINIVDIEQTVSFDAASTDIAAPFKQESLDSLSQLPHEVQKYMMSYL